MCNGSKNTLRGAKTIRLLFRTGEDGKGMSQLMDEMVKSILVGENSVIFHDLKGDFTPAFYTEEIGGDERG